MGPPDDDENDHDIITKKTISDHPMTMTNNDGEDDSSQGDANGDSPELRQGWRGVEQWMAQRERKMNDEMDGPPPSPDGSDLKDETQPQPNQDQVEPVEMGSRANLSSPELDDAMDQLCKGITQCQLED